MAYKNPIFEFADNHPFIAFWLVPIGMSMVGRATAMAIRSGKHGSPLAAIMPTHQGEPLNLGSVRVQQGDPSDFMFRPTARLGPNSTESSVREWVQPPPESRHVRYDRAWHEDGGFLNDPNYKERSRPVTSTSVFAGLNGIDKLRY
jgi:hypothetical protein